MSVDGVDATSAEKGRLTAVLVLVASAAVLGLAPVLVRFSDAGPAATGFWRLAFALPMLGLAFVATKGKDAARAKGVPSAGGWIALAGVFFVLDLSFWHYAIGLTSVANATVLTNLTPVVVTLAAWLLFRERPSGLFVLALACAIGGAWGLSVGASAGPDGRHPWLGDLFATTSALWYAGYFLAVKQARRSRNALAVMLGSSAVAAPLLLLTALALKETLTPLTATGWMAVAGLGLVHVLGQGGIAWALGQLPTALTAVTVLIQPVVAALLGWLLFHEALTPLQAAGGMLVLLGVVMAQAASGPRRRPRKKGAEAEAAAP